MISKTTTNIYRASIIRKTDIVPFAVYEATSIAQARLIASAKNKRCKGRKIKIDQISYYPFPTKTPLFKGFKYLNLM